ncbi:MAG: hypothetical protein HY011_08745 [Acidobacteria bacterium]|nr:hypothetical protein [Acidobacteriota bacterium]
MPNDLNQDFVTLRASNRTVEPLATVQERLAHALNEYILHPDVSTVAAKRMAEIVMYILESPEE